MNEIVDDLLDTIQDGMITQVLIGLHWTAVVAESGGRKRCGLASTLRSVNRPNGQPEVPQAGRLTDQSRSTLAAMIRSDHLSDASIGMAAINALLPLYPEAWVDMNAEELIAELGVNREVALVGHFPFVPRLLSRVGRLHVLERNPKPGDVPSTAASKILPQADVVAITGTALINHTLEDLLSYCSPGAAVIILGPSTPLSPVLFDHGVDFLCGSVVTEIAPVLRVVGQGGNFRQVHRVGVRTVTMTRTARKVE